MPSHMLGPLKNLIIRKMKSCKKQDNIINDNHNFNKKVGLPWISCRRYRTDGYSVPPGLCKKKKIKKNYTTVARVVLVLVRGLLYEKKITKSILLMTEETTDTNLFTITQYCKMWNSVRTSPQQSWICIGKKFLSKQKFDSTTNAPSNFFRTINQTFGIVFNSKVHRTFL